MDSRSATVKSNTYVTVGETEGADLPAGLPVVAQCSPLVLTKDIITFAIYAKSHNNFLTVVG